MSLLDNLFSFSTQHYTNQRGQSLILRTSRFRYDTQDSQGSPINNRSRIDIKSLQKASKLKVNQQILLKNSTKLFKLYHIFDKKLKHLRYFVWIKVQNNRKKSKQVENDLKIQQQKQKNQQNIQKYSQKYIFNIKYLSQTLQLISLKNFSIKNKAVSFVKIKQLVDQRKKSQFFLNSINQMICNKIIQHKNLAIIKIKKRQRQHEKTQLFIDVFSSYHKKCQKKIYDQVFKQIQNNSSKILQQFQKVELVEKKKIHLHVKQKKNIQNLQNQKITYYNNNFNTYINSQPSKILSKLSQQSKPLALKVNLIEKSLNLNIQNQYQDKSIMILHRQYPDQISKQVEDISDTIKFNIIQNSFNHLNTVISDVQQSVNPLNASLRTSITGQMKLQNLLYQIQQLKQKQEKQSLQFKNIKFKNFNSNSQKNLFTSQYKQFVKTSTQNKSMTRESTPNNINKQSKNNICAQSANSSIQNHITPISKHKHVASNNISAKSSVSKKIKESCMLNQQHKYENGLQKLSINLTQTKQYRQIKQSKIKKQEYCKKILKPRFLKDPNYINKNSQPNILNAASKPNVNNHDITERKRYQRKQQIKPTQFKTIQIARNNRVQPFYLNFINFNS